MLKQYGARAIINIQPGYTYKYSETCTCIYKDHNRAQIKCGPYRQVVYICSYNSTECTHLGTYKTWVLQKKVVFRAGFTVYYYEHVCYGL